jgi:hypothetical protein
MVKKLVFPLLIIGIISAGVYVYYRHLQRTSPRTAQVYAWLRNPSPRSELMMTDGTRCGDAPFAFPTNGLIGFIWDDSFQLGHRHQGIDIFSGTEIGVTRVTAAYPGYLSRLPNWKSSVIVRVPSDPLNPGRQIWIYYTHMADPKGNSFISAEFPAGTKEVHVDAGTFLGFQGDYSGDPNNPVGVHLHVSVVKDDGSGNFKNELDINNTYDPSPYFGLALNANLNRDTIPVCNH